MLAEQVVQEVAAVVVDAAAEADSAEAESAEAESAEAESAEAHESADGRHCPDPCSLSLPLYRQGDPWSHRWSSTSVR